MIRSTITVATVLLAVAACASAPGDTAQPALSRDAIPQPGEQAMRIWREAVVIDMHNDVPSMQIDDGYDLDARHTPAEGHSDLPRFMESGMTAQFLSAWVDATYAFTDPPGSYRRSLVYMDSIRAWVTRHPEQLIFATTSADAHRAKREGKVAMFIGVEGGHAMENSLDNLRELHRRGARYLTLTWNNGTDWAGAAVGMNGTRTGGLTDFGREVVREMNRLGMMVDISHVSDSTFFDAVAVSTHPVIASHSSARAINPHPRNMSDDQLRAVARNGGVVAVNFYSRFLDARVDSAMTRMEAHLASARDSLGRTHGSDTARVNSEARALGQRLRSELPTAPFGILIDHIEHIARVAGVDHVGLGSDFDGIPAAPDGMEDILAMPRIVQGLLDRGWSEEDIRKVLGGNMLRVMEAVLR